MFKNKGWKSEDRKPKILRWALIVCLWFSFLFSLLLSQDNESLSAQALDELEEVVEKRTGNSKTYYIGTLPDGRNRYAWSGALADIHYESDPGSGIYDASIDMTPKRVKNANLDGWTIVQNNWHYALGKPSDKTADGWVGFGGRQGQNWFKFRLSSVGYFHWLTKEWEDIGGEPAYDRSNLSSQIYSLPFGPDKEEIAVESMATWSNLWSTPNEGTLNISWKANSGTLKEEISINQEAREWISENRAPAMPLDETWFGFIFQVDWSDVPRIYRAETLKSSKSDFSDDGKNILLKDNLGRLLAFLPISDAWVEDENREEIEGSRVRLRKRFYENEDASYFLVGLRADVLASLPEGTLVIDPTLNYQVSASSDDAFEASGGSVTTTGSNWKTDDAGEWAGNRFASVAVPAGATIDLANWLVRPINTNNDDPDLQIGAQDADDPVTFSSTTNDISGRGRTSASVYWTATGIGAGSLKSSPDIKSIIQEVVDRPGWNSGQAMVIISAERSGGTSNLAAIAYDGLAAGAPGLYIEYTEGAANSPPNAPQSPYVDNDTAQSGQASPVYGLIDHTPAFSAIYDDDDTSDVSSSFEIEVGSDTDWVNGAELWDTGETAMSSCDEGDRCSDIIYDGSSLSDGVTYYWRMRFGDSSGAAGTWSETMQFTMNNAPTTANVSLNSGSDIELEENTTVSVAWAGTVSDGDGYEDIATAQGKIYRSGVSGGEECSTSNSDCYIDSSCDLSGCSGNSCTATCNVDVYFFADPTDTGSPYSAQYWLGWIEVTDDYSETGEGFSPSSTTDIQSLQAINVTSSISYGQLFVGDDTGSDNETTLITNTGNRQVDINLAGDHMCTDYSTCSELILNVNNQQYSLIGFTYGNGSSLAIDSSLLDVDLSKPTTSPSNSTANIYWGIGIPDPQGTGEYSGVNTISAANDQ